MFERIEFDRNRARALLAAGMSMHEAAEDCGISYNTMRSWVRYRKIPHQKSKTKPRFNRSCKFVPEWRFRELWERGYSVGVIAYIYDVSVNALYQHARRSQWISGKQGHQPINISKVPKWYLKELKAEIRA